MSESGQTRSAGSRFRTWLLGTCGAGAWLWLSLVVIALDQLSKREVIEHLEYARSYPVLPFFDLTRLHNTGAAFSFLSDAAGWQRWLFIGLGAGVSVFIMVWLRRLPTRGQAWLASALALILGGALGNAIDRALYGHVIDFLHLHYKGLYWPAFNVADTAISIGAVMLVLESLFSRRA